MRKEQTKQIGEHTFTVRQLPAMRATKLLWRLQAMILPAIGKVMGGALGDAQASMQNIMQAQVNVGAMFAGGASAAETLFEKMNENDFEKLTRELLETTTVSLEGNDRPVLSVYEEVFGGAIGSVFQLVWFALTVNYSDFLPGLVAKVSQLQTMAVKPKSAA